MQNTQTTEQFLGQYFPEATTSIQRDLQVNFKKILDESPLEPSERFLNLLAIATTLKHKELMSFAEGNLKAMDFNMEQIQEAKESAAIMGMLNTYYKFKSFLAPEAVENYQRAGLRMQSLMKPANGKERFEMMSLSVSIINGCPTCVSSHERALIQLGTPAEKIHDLAKLAAITKGLTSL